MLNPDTGWWRLTATGRRTDEGCFARTLELASDWERKSWAKGGGVVVGVGELQAA
jgi:hypothetical protein